MKNQEEEKETPNINAEEEKKEPVEIDLEAVKIQTNFMEMMLAEDGSEKEKMSHLNITKSIEPETGTSPKEAKNSAEDFIESIVSQKVDIPVCNYGPDCRCTPTAEAGQVEAIEPDANKVVEAKPEVKIIPIHCTVLDMNIKIDFNDKRSKFIQLSSIEEDDSLQRKSKYSESIVEPKTDELQIAKEEKEEVVNVKHIGDPSEQSSDDNNNSQEPTFSETALQEEDGLDDQTKIADREMFWAGFSVKKPLEVNENSSSFKAIQAEEQIEENKTGFMSICQNITSELQNVQAVVDRIAVDRKDELNEKEKKSENIIAYSADSESQWSDNQYKKVINDVVYYFNNSDANGKVDQVKDNQEVAVLEEIIGVDPIDNIMTNEIVAKIREDRKVNQVFEVDLEENIPETNIKDNETPEINHVDEELDFSAVMEIDESATSKVHSDTFLHPVAFECTDSKTQPSIDSGNDCNGQVEDKKLFAIIDEIPQNPVTTENFDFATTGSYKQAEIDPMPSDPGTIEEKEQRPKSASHSRQTTASNKHKIEEELRESDEEKAAKREEDTAIDEEENLPPEKPISFNKMKNRASKDLNITPMRSDSRRPKSARVRTKKEVEKTRPTRPQSSRVQGVDRCKERARLTSKGLVRQKSREVLEVQGRRSREDMELEGRRRKELLEVQGKNCRNIMELLTEEGEEGMDYMARGVLPSRPYTGPVIQHVSTFFFLSYFSLYIYT